MTYIQLKDLINVDLVDYTEAPGMRLILRFRIHRETNEQPYLDLINIKGSSTIVQDNDRFPIIEVEFESYIGFSIRNEIYTMWDKYEDFEGKIFRIFKKSRYLDLIKLSTFATEDYPGPYRHYGIAGLNHIVDIVSIEDPEIRI
ncbi:hypothetical protein ABGV43_22430 [Paenibacillus amylolyticus]|uniref:hypothetical protein n=1 Tax=Paenibacillus amylolyticus TaxID=1451 RepID=UPI003241C25C